MAKKSPYDTSDVGIELLRAINKAGPGELTVSDLRRYIDERLRGRKLTEKELHRIGCRLLGAIYSIHDPDETQVHPTGNFGALLLCLIRQARKL